MRAKLVSQPQPERIELAKHIPLATPFVVYIEPSGFCNLQCSFCPQTSRDKGFVRDMMTLKLWRKAIDDLADFPKKIKLLRVCGNGEPLTNPALTSMLKYAKESGHIKRIELITNGTLLNKHLAENLPKYADRIIISVEALSASGYEKVSGVRIDWKKFVNKVRKLYINSDDCIIHIKIHHDAVKSKDNKDRFFGTFGDICDEIYIENLIQMWPEFNSANATGRFRYGGTPVKKKVCVQIFKGFQIQANGEVVPCCVDWKRINILGDINKRSVKKIWKGKKLRDLQAKHLLGQKSKIRPCKSCTMNDLNDTDNIDDFAKEIQKLI